MFAEVQEINAEQDGDQVGMEIPEFYQFIFEKSFSILDMKAERWTKMIENLSTMNLVNFNRFVDKLGNVNWMNAESDFRKTIYQELDNWVLFNKRLNDEAKKK
jgi:hypothetical protein